MTDRKATTLAENQELVFYAAGFSFPSGFDILDSGQSVTLSPKCLSLSEENAEAYRLAVEQACIECFGAAELGEMSQMTDFEKVVAAHDWVVAHCKYDPYTKNGNQDYVTAQGTVFSNNREVYSSYDAFVNRTAVCQGYALSLKVLLDRANVPLLLRAGQSRHTAPCPESGPAGRNVVPC